MIYPAGAIEDYEPKFYLAFQVSPSRSMRSRQSRLVRCTGGFNANFLEPKAARAALEGRVEADLG